MTSLSCYRKLDAQNRIELPAEYCQVLQYEQGQTLIVHLRKAGIYLESPLVSCQICGSSLDIQQVYDMTLCSDCISRIVKFTKQKKKSSR